MKSGNDQVSPVPNREITLHYVFHAPRALVFKAWTTPELLAQWWGPKDFTNPVVQLDVRPGGLLYINMRGPDGTSIPNKGIFHEVIEPERLVFLTSAMEDHNGQPQLEILNTVTFEEEAGTTRVTLKTVILTATAAMETSLARMEEGWTQSLNRLEQRLFPEAQDSFRAPSL